MKHEIDPSEAGFVFDSSLLTKYPYLAGNQRTATVVFIRDSTLARTFPFDLLINGNSSGSLLGGTFSYVSLEPGNLNIVIQCVGNEVVLQVDAQKGKVYFVQMACEAFGFTSPKPRARFISMKDGKELLGKCKYVNTVTT